MIKPLKAVSVVRQDGNYVFVTFFVSVDEEGQFHVEKTEVSNVDVKAIIAYKALDVVWRQASGE